MNEEDARRRIRSLETALFDGFVLGYAVALHLHDIDVATPQNKRLYAILEEINRRDLTLTGDDSASLRNSFPPAVWAAMVEQYNVGVESERGHARAIMSAFMRLDSEGRAGSDERP